MRAVQLPSLHDSEAGVPDPLWEPFAGEIDYEDPAGRLIPQDPPCTTYGLPSSLAVQAGSSGPTAPILSIDKRDVQSDLARRNGEEPQKTAGAPNPKVQQSSSSLPSRKDALAPVSAHPLKEALPGSHVDQVQVKLRTTLRATSLQDLALPFHHTLSVEVVPTDLRRGVCLEHVLSGFGKNWTGQVAGGLGTEQVSLFQLSEPVSQLEAFVSHDGVTSRLLKCISLCLIYNGRPAVVAAYVVSLVVGFLQTDLLRALPRPVPFHKEVYGHPDVDTNIGCLAVFFGPLTFLFVLSSWQGIRRLCRRKRLFLFVDALCIQPTPSSFKQAGIKVLPGFLSMSDRLIVLWSERYLSRLWCVYEWALWIHHKQTLNGVLFVPVMLGVLLAILFFGVWLLCIFLTFSRNLEGFHITIFGVVCPVASVLAGDMAESLHKASTQVSGFKVKEAACFCCTHQHTHPQTRQGIDCDREVMFSTLKQLFGKPGEHRRSEAHLKAFEEVVQEYLKPEALRRTSAGSFLSLDQALMVTVPGVAYLCDRISVIASSQRDCSIRILVAYVCTVFLVLPLVPKFLVILASWNAWLQPAGRNPLKRLILGTMVSISWTASCIVLFYLEEHLTDSQPLLPQALVNAALFLLTLALFCCQARWLRNPLYR